MRVEDALTRVTTGLPGGGEVRAGQLAMARRVAEALTAERHLVVQAGTGTGKSLAYLVPLILHGRPAVVATATKALQDQLAGKDLPFLQERLGRNFDFAVLKGRSNYLCRQRLRELARSGDGTSPSAEQLGLDEAEPAADGSAPAPGGLAEEVLRLVAWSERTTTGDRAELDFEPRPAAWSAVSVTSVECPGRTRCPAGDECFAEAARDAAALANVTVVNTHLYATHIALGSALLPEHDVVVFDEAHELEDVASSSLGFEVSGGRFRHLSRITRSLLARDQATLAEDIDGAGIRIEAAIADLTGKRLPPGLGEDVAAAVSLAAERTSRLTSAVRDRADDDPARQRALQALGHMAADLAKVADLGDSDVAWVEGPAHAPVLKVAPIDVGHILNEKLWGHVTAVVTSATIPPGYATRIGLPDHDAADVGSPFPYESQALLYCARHMPDPRQPAYGEALTEELLALMTAAGGRTLGLFTSWRAMRAAADELGPRMPWTLLTQSDLPKPALLERFTTDEQSCLFATMGFWQGVDVPGPALSLVVIDRIPFPRPDEPLLQARRDRAGRAAFRVIDLPRAATLLAQGAGRLIRNSQDRGVVAVLDPRLATASYRWELVRALPPMARTRHRHEAEAFLTALWTTGADVAQ